MQMGGKVCLQCLKKKACWHFEQLRCTTTSPRVSLHRPERRAVKQRSCVRPRFTIPGLKGNSRVVEKKVRHYSVNCVSKSFGASHRQVAAGKGPPLTAKPTRHIHRYNIPGEQLSPGTVQSGQQASKARRQMPHTSSFTSHFHTATPCHLPTPKQQDKDRVKPVIRCCNKRWYVTAAYPMALALQLLYAI